MHRAALILIVGLLMPAAAGAADPAAGEAVFNRCKICHTIAEGGGKKVGPNLHHIFGRHAGAAEGFPYSAAMKQSGIVWNDETLAEYLRDPRKFMPGNRMAFPGIKNEEQLSDLLAYLHQAAQ